jgi:hypothetical protein
MLILLSLIIGSASSKAERPSNVNNIEPIGLLPGANKVSRFADDGRDAIVTLAWRDNGNAWGYDVILVMQPTNRGGSDWNVVGIQPPPTSVDQTLRDVIRDSPHTGEDVIRAVRLARGNVDGRPSTLLLVAERDIVNTVPEPARVKLEIYRLVHAPEIGTTIDSFKLIDSRFMGGKFCDAEGALARAFAIQPRRSSMGPATPDGC